MSYGKKVVVQCKHCKDEFTARVADRKRGWARFCSKSCKAKNQEKRTGQYARYKQRMNADVGFVDDFSSGDFDDVVQYDRGDFD